MTGVACPVTALRQFGTAVAYPVAGLVNTAVAIGVAYHVPGGVHCTVERGMHYTDCLVEGTCCLVTTTALCPMCSVA